MDQTADASQDGRSLRVGGAALDDEALDGLLQRVVELAHRTVAGAHAVSITVVDKGAYRTSNSTRAEALAIDLAQYAADDGPCLTSMRTAEQQQFSMTGAGDRWPTVAERALELGVGGVLSTPLIVEGRASIGALNVYAIDGEGFGEEERRTASLLSEHAAILVGNALALTGGAGRLPGGPALRALDPSG
ncbi:MAG TPA: GAF domain-containing protein, partial [Acidimicrobiales bacterium]|nr:GAF domain-containing protein [Acidimicrobiales bacterium]